VQQFLAQNLPMLILADVGNVAGEAREKLARWIDEGGVLVRFAGPRLAGSEDDARVRMFMGLALGIMNLGFMAVLVYFIRNNMRMMAVIAVQNATLEQRVAERTAQLSQKTSDINAMLQNMKLGVSTVIPGNRIHPEYSNYLTTIFCIDDLADKDIVAYVVSMPCVEWFESQPKEYRDQVLPPDVSARVAVEAGVAQSWHKLVGDTGEIVSIEHYGASADDKTLFREFGFTPEAVVAAAERSMDN